MRNWLLVVLYLLFALAVVWTIGGHIAKADEPGNPSTPTDWGAAVEAATVQVFDESLRMGTGTIIGPNVVLTVAHILEGDSQVVVFQDGSSAPVTVMYENRLLDVALLMILSHQSPAPIEVDCAPLTRGTPFVWVGNPVGFEWNWGQGVVSSDKRPYPWLMAVSAPFNHGDSGSGIIDENHKLRGLVVGMMGEGSENGLILPASNFCGIGMALNG